MSGVLLILLLGAALFLHAATRTAGERVHHVGLSRLAVRFLTGRPWHGKALTDAGFFRKGTRALTHTGHASRFAHRPGWQRLLMRSLPVLALLLAGYGWVFYRGTMVVVLWVCLPLALAGAGLFVWWRVRRFQHRRHVLYPLHAALAPHLNVGLPSNPEAWLKVPLDKSWARIELPASFDANTQKMTAVGQAAAARLGMRDWEPKWELAGRKPLLILTVIPPLPKRVPLAGPMAEAVQAAGPDELVLGEARGPRVVTWNLAAESPHAGLSIGTGGGKSVTAELLASQAAFKGAIVLVLDFPKLVSLPALRGLPNVAYADSAALVHSACAWLARELEDRAALVRAHTDFEGVYHGPYLPRIFVIAEESNALMDRLRSYWADIRTPQEPRRSPAIDGLELALLMGRQLHINIVQIGQFLSVRATGSGAARENMGVRFLGRATVNNWKILVPEHPYPGKTQRPGRVHVITDDCTEVQLVDISHREARHLALAGTVTPCPVGMPGRQRVPGSAPPSLREPEQPRPSGTAPDVSPDVPPADVGVSISEAIALGILPGRLYAERKAMHRAKRAGTNPHSLGYRGTAEIWDPGDLAEWVRRREEKVAA